MPNPNGKPPVPDGSNKLQGIPISKIDLLDLGHIVRKLRKAKVSYIDIAAELNEKYSGDTYISTMSVNRWCRKYIQEDDNCDLRQSEDHAVNVYRQECEMLETISEQIENIKIYIDQFNTEIKKGTDVTSIAPKVKDMLFLLDKLMARKSAILANIGNMQEKVYNYMNMTEINDIILGMVKEQDLVLYANIVERIQSNPVLAELYRKIKPGKA